MTIYLHDKRPKKGMLQAAKEQGFEEAMKQVEERLRTERDAWTAAYKSACAISDKRRNAVIEECAQVAEDYAIARTGKMYGKRIAIAIRALKERP